MEENNKNRKKKKKKKELRPWDALPSLPLFNIFRNLHFKDRFGSIPLVCKSWNSVISDDPRCWSSMIPDSISPDDAFIKKPVYSIQQVDLPSTLVYRQSRRQEIVRDPGISYFRNFIKKSTSSSSLGGGGGSSSSSTITSLFLDPFHFSNSYTKKTPIHPDDEHRPIYEIHQDEILGLIAQCCPNLKHISFDGFFCALHGASRRKAVLEVFKRCNKIELIDFSHSGYANIHVIEVLGKCLPNLRGIRMAGWQYYDIHDAIATHLPRIKLLAVDYRSLYDKDFQKLTSETECCLYELQYLSVAVYSFIKYPPPVCTHIPEFHYEENQYDWDIKCVKCIPHDSTVRRKFPLHPDLDPPLCFNCYFTEQEKASEIASEIAREIAREKAREEAYFEYYFEMEYSRFDEVYYSIMKQKKECEYYVSISKEKKKRTRRNHPYVVLRTRMRKDKNEASFISKMKMRKKRDKYDYQDYYVQPLLPYR